LIFINLASIYIGSSTLFINPASISGRNVIVNAKYGQVNPGQRTPGQVNPRQVEADLMSIYLYGIDEN